MGTKKGKKKAEPANAPAESGQPAPERATAASSTKKQADIPAAFLIAAPWNKRDEIEAESVADLVASIKAVGLIQRVTVMRDRPDDAGERFIILAGHRRVKACQLAGLSPIPCEVVECDDKTAHMITAVENMHRADLTSMQEAEVVEDLLGIGYSAEEIAERTGWHLRRVYRRASLQTLTPDWRNTAHAQGLCAAFLEEVSRLPAQTQDAVHKRISDRWDCEDTFDKGGDVGVIRHVISDLVMSVSKAPWAKKHPEWCAGCERCSDARANLFDETEVGENALCLDRPCWDQRKAALVEEQKAELEANHGEVKTATDQDYRYGRLSDAKGRKDKAHSKPVLITDGDNAGKVLWVASAADKKAAKERGDPVTESRQPTVEQKRMAWVIRRVREMIEASRQKGSLDNPFVTFSDYAILQVVALTGTEHASSWNKAKDWSGIEGKSDTEVCAELWGRVAPVLISRINYSTIIECKPYYDEAVAQAAWLFSVTQENLDAEAAEAIKDKSKKGAKI